MKKWKLVILSPRPRLFSLGMPSGPNGLWLIGVSMKPFQPCMVTRRRSVLSPASSTASCNQRQVPQPSTGWEMAVVFFALRVLESRSSPETFERWFEAMLSTASLSSTV